MAGCKNGRFLAPTQQWAGRIVYDKVGCLIAMVWGLWCPSSFSSSGAWRPMYLCKILRNSSSLGLLSHLWTRNKLSCLRCSVRPSLHKRVWNSGIWHFFWVPRKTYKMDNHIPSGNEDRLQCLVTPHVCGGRSLSAGICLEFSPQPFGGFSLTPNTLEMFLCDLWLRTSYQPFLRKRTRGRARDSAFKKCHVEPRRAKHWKNFATFIWNPLQRAVVPPGDPQLSFPQVVQLTLFQTAKHAMGFRYKILPRSSKLFGDNTWFCFQTDCRPSAYPLQNNDLCHLCPDHFEERHAVPSFWESHCRDVFLDEPHYYSSVGGWQVFVGIPVTPNPVVKGLSKSLDTLGNRSLWPKL